MKRCSRSRPLCGSPRSSFDPRKRQRNTWRTFISLFASRPSLNTRDIAASFWCRNICFWGGCTVWKLRFPWISQFLLPNVRQGRKILKRLSVEFQVSLVFSVVCQYCRTSCQLRFCYCPWNAETDVCDIFSVPLFVRRTESKPAPISSRSPSVCLELYVPSVMSVKKRKHFCFSYVRLRRSSIAKQVQVLLVVANCLHMQQSNTSGDEQLQNSKWSGFYSNMCWFTAFPFGGSGEVVPHPIGGKGDGGCWPATSWTDSSSSEVLAEKSGLDLGKCELGDPGNDGGGSTSSPTVLDAV